MPYRIIQQKIADIANRITKDEPIYNIYLHGQPGGGKSYCPAILSYTLAQAGMDHKLLWIVPRAALREQAIEDFSDPFITDIFSKSRRLNEIIGSSCSPSNGADGFVVTYDSARTGYESYSDELDTSNYILVLDEFHHLCQGQSPDEDSITYSVIAPLIEKATIRLMMSGSWDRHDGRMIGGMPYFSMNGKEYPINEGNCNKLDIGEEYIRYSRRDALGERAILPLKFYHTDGEVHYLNREGKPVDQTLSCADGRDALYVALDTEYGRKLLHECLDHWKEHSTGQMLVTCSNIPHADDVLSEIQRRHFNANKSTTKDDPSNVVIRDFKKGLYDCLVTVGRAYEGLNVPSITHICSLTHIRSRQWIDQMLNRATRVERGIPYAEQMAHAFVPDDVLMNDIIEEIRKEQVDACVEKNGESTPGPGPSGNNGIIALGSAATRQYISWLDDKTSDMLSVLTRRGIKEEDAYEILIELKLTDPEKILSDGISISTEVEKKMLRKAIQSKFASICIENGYDHAVFGAKMKNKYGTRDDTTPLETLRYIWSDINKRYPLCEPVY